MPKASVKIMLSYDYCHFETTLSTDEDISLEQIDELRKNAQRLADKAVSQYQIAKEKAQLRLRLQEEKKQLVIESKRIHLQPEKEWTAEDRAKVKALEDFEYWSQYDYDYEN